MDTAVVVVSVVLFLAAASVHGQQLRLERQAAGFQHVVFSGKNAPEVEALWRADRIRFLWLAALLAATTAPPAALLFNARGYWFIDVLLWSPTTAFLVCAAASRRRRSLKGEPRKKPLLQP